MAIAARSATTGTATTAATIATIAQPDRPRRAGGGAVPRGAAAYGRRAADGLAEETGGGVAGGSGGGCEASGATVSSCSPSEQRSSGCHSPEPACQAREIRRASGRERVVQYW